MKTYHRLLALLVVLPAGAVLTGMDCQGNGIVLPTGFTNANAARGGAMYDKWWKVNGAVEPTGEHPRYPAVGQKSGSTTWRCKECHGWDYKGAAGAYATGSSHFTGIKGLFGTTLDAQAVFDEIKAHAMPGLTDTDVWDLAKFVLGGDSGDMGAQFDTNTIISGTMFTGNAATGATLYSSGIGTGTACTICHGADGKTIPPGGPATFDDWVGKIANENPWEFQHKVRFGQPATAMPASTANGGTTQEVADLSTHAQTLPQS